MSDIMTNYLQILDDSLNKKLTILEELTTLTMEQKKLSEAEKFDDEAFNDTVHKKSSLIEELEKLDEGFQTLYDRVKEQLTGNKERYSTEIGEFKKKIARILDLSTGLEAMERRNRTQGEKRFREAKQEVRQVKKTRQTAANYYRTMNKISEEPYFLDTKK